MIFCLIVLPSTKKLDSSDPQVGDSPITNFAGHQSRCTDYPAADKFSHVYCARGEPGPPHRLKQVSVCTKHAHLAFSSTCYQSSVVCDSCDAHSRSAWLGWCRRHTSLDAWRHDNTGRWFPGNITAVAGIVDGGFTLPRVSGRRRD